ncbi:hypothetical protein [Acetobacterium woodii]|nr:hypothetical protein [Acetobacterium woodii]
MGIFNNDWFIGICTGLITMLVGWGISRIIAFFTKKASERKVDNEYREKVKYANDYILRLFAEELSYCNKDEDINKGLNKKLIQTIINSVALKQNVLLKDIYNVNEFCQLILLKVMETTFISHDRKVLYYDLIFTISEETTSESEVPELDHIQELIQKRISENVARIEEKNKTINEFMAMIAAVIATFSTVFSILYSQDVIVNSILNVPFIFILAASVLIIASVMTLIQLINIIKNK